MRESAFQVGLLFLCECEFFKENLDRSNSSEDHIFPPERVFPEKDLEGCCLLMLVAHEVRVGASELIEVAVEEGVLAKNLLLNHELFIRHIRYSFIYFCEF